MECFLFSNLFVFALGQLFCFQFVTVTLPITTAMTLREWIWREWECSFCEFRFESFFVQMLSSLKRLLLRQCPCYVDWYVVCVVERGHSLRLISLNWPQTKWKWKIKLNFRDTHCALFCFVFGLLCDCTADISLTFHVAPQSGRWHCSLSLSVLFEW